MIAKQAMLTVTLNTLPQESLSALKSAVAQRFNWRIFTSKDNDQPRFVIEKKVRYDLVRSLPMYALYQIIGSFQKTKSGDTVLQYAVSGQVGIPFFHGALTVGVLLIFTFLLASFVFSPDIGGNWIGILLVGVLLVTSVGYGWLAYRSYQGHLQELNRFMETFAQQMGAHA